MISVNRLKAFLQNERQLFIERRVESPALSVELLLAEAMGIERAALLKLLIMNPDYELSGSELESYRNFAHRRLNGEPVAYIIGYREFYGRNFEVAPATLIPRPETELLVDTAVSELESVEQGRFADLGTGSGCIAITLALELGPGWQGVALDISEAALEFAGRNAASLGAAEQVSFVQADFTSYVFELSSLDLLASNPPYVSEGEFSGLDRGVRAYEPRAALVPADGSVRGTEHLLAIASLAARALKPGGLLLMEMGCGQGGEMRSVLLSAGFWADVRIIKDLAGLDRLVFARLSM